MSNDPASEKLPTEKGRGSGLVGWPLSLLKAAIERGKKVEQILPGFLDFSQPDSPPCIQWQKVPWGDEGIFSLGKASVSNFYLL